jgi:hypothetical protein
MADRSQMNDLFSLIGQTELLSDMHLIGSTRHRGPEEEIIQGRSFKLQVTCDRPYLINSSHGGFHHARSTAKSGQCLYFSKSQGTEYTKGKGTSKDKIYV